jgi:multidrug efflux pump subunit AcrB
VVIPLEEEINGVEGMTYMTSQQLMMVQLKFLFICIRDQPDIAAVNVKIE